MAEHQTSPGTVRPGTPEAPPHVSAVAVTGVVFGACVMGIVGAFHAIAGLSAILNENFYQQQNDYPFDFDVNGRGWVQLISGVLMVAAACALFTGRTWARIVGIVFAGLSAIENFLFTPYYPVWAAIIIVLDVLVIWSLTVYGKPQAQKVYGA
ncbi:DUF7144 family membrane protein [Streptomyces longispororuber]|uniref:DUF7144 family membrane protein n=1 Tax=Streptomyces longispororuber TaxID=68230 RepID=UPI00210A7F3F|nr:hypothetical protein [Streptomyces longispororuber]MCQ4206020.1 hypothetical protein [Streptomyces longispororuber]